MGAKNSEKHKSESTEVEKAMQAPRVKLIQVPACRVTDALLLYFALAPHLLDLLALALNVLERFSSICLGDAEKYCLQPPKPSARRWARHPHPQRIAQPETPH